MNKIFFISGVCGAGKSSIIPHLKSALPSKTYQVYDFDARGVPENADHKWRFTETQHWINEGIKLSEKNKSIVVCGFTNPDEFGNEIEHERSGVVFILLDAKPKIIRQRLESRYTKNGIFDKEQKVIGMPVNDFIDSSVKFVKQMRNIFKKHNCPIVDTSKLTPEKVSKVVADIITTKTNS